jgi:hypothetical protein
MAWEIAAVLCLSTVIFLSFALAWLFGQSKDEIIRALKFVFFIFAFALSLISIRLAGIFAEVNSADAKIISMLNTAWIIAVPILLLVAGILFIYLIKETFAWLKGIISDYMERRKNKG